MSLQNDGFLPTTLNLSLQRPDLTCIEYSPKEAQEYFVFVHIAFLSFD